MSSSNLRKQLQDIRSRLLHAGEEITEMWARKEPNGDIWEGFCAIEGRTLELTGRSLELRWKNLLAAGCRFSPILFERAEGETTKDRPYFPFPHKIYVNIDPERI